MKTMKKMLTALLAVSMIMSLMATTAFAATFTDVPEKHWAYDAVERAVVNDLVHGVGNSKYDPDRSVTNAEWSQMVANLLWEDLEENTYSFDPWWYAAASYNYTVGWLDGTTMGDSYTGTADYFTSKTAGAVINRYDMAQVVYNVSTSRIGLEDDETGTLFNLTVDTTGINNAIADYRNIPSKYRTAVEYCYAAGIIVGVDKAGTFDGEGAMTRGAAATVLTRLLDCQNGNWVIPERNGNTEQPSNTAVKDMITVKSSEMKNFDYEVTVSNTRQNGKLSNGKDITSTNITAMLNELKAMFPEGTSWGNPSKGDTYYYQGTAFGGGGDCNAWAYMTFDVLFGTGTKATSSANIRDAKPGDVIAWKDSTGTTKHWIVVTSVTSDTIYYCNGNASSKVGWDRKMTFEVMQDWYPKSTLYTAY